MEKLTIRKINLLLESRGCFDKVKQKDFDWAINNNQTIETSTQKLAIINNVLFGKNRSDLLDLGNYENESTWHTYPFQFQKQKDLKEWIEDFNNSKREFKLFISENINVEKNDEYLFNFHCKKNEIDNYIHQGISEMKTLDEKYSNVIKELNINPEETIKKYNEKNVNYNSQTLEGVSKIQEIGNKMFDKFIPMVREHKNWNDISNFTEIMEKLPKYNTKYKDDNNNVKSLFENINRYISTDLRMFHDTDVMDQETYIEYCPDNDSPYCETSTFHWWDLKTNEKGIVFVDFTNYFEDEEWEIIHYDDEDEWTNEDICNLLNKFKNVFNNNVEYRKKAINDRERKDYNNELK